MTEYKPKKRWLEFVDVSFPSRKTKTFQVKNIVTGDMLGTVTWSPHWRQYVFDDGEIFMAEGCLYEVFEKIKELREERGKHGKD